MNANYFYVFQPSSGNALFAFVQAESYTNRSELYEMTMKIHDLN